jgi:glutamate--cysteine ligase
VGIRNPGGDYNQLGTSLLQIENEFYGTIRPKRTVRTGERPLHALRERGVEYVEVRLMDLDPFVPVGITAPTMRLLDVFLLHCLLSDSPPDTPKRLPNSSATSTSRPSVAASPACACSARARMWRWWTGAAQVLARVRTPGRRAGRHAPVHRLQRRAAPAPAPPWRPSARPRPACWSTMAREHGQQL